MKNDNDFEWSQIQADRGYTSSHALTHFDNLSSGIYDYASNAFCYGKAYPLQICSGSGKKLSKSTKRRVCHQRNVAKKKKEIWTYNKTKLSEAEIKLYDIKLEYYSQIVPEMERRVPRSSSSSSSTNISFINIFEKLQKQQMKEISYSIRSKDIPNVLKSLKMIHKPSIFQGLESNLYILKIVLRTVGN